MATITEWGLLSALMLVACQNSTDDSGPLVSGTGTGDETTADASTGTAVDCPEDTVVEGDLVVGPATDVMELACIVAVEGDLRVGPTTVLPNLAFLGRLERITGSVWIEDNAALATLDGLERVAGVGPRPGWSGVVALSRNPMLTDVTALSTLAEQSTSTARLQVVDDDALVDLEGLDGITQLGELRIDGNDGLVSLSGLEGLTKATIVALHRNSVLADLSGIAGLEQVDEELSLGYCSADTETGNAALVSLAGLDALNSVGALYIVENFALTSLDGASMLASGRGSVQRVMVGENPLLDTQIAEMWVASLQPAGEVTICGNADGEPCSCGSP